ncbi:MAG: spherulation-specific family 4 protein [Thermomicrobiales bacterium]
MRRSLRVVALLALLVGGLAILPRETLHSSAQDGSPAPALTRPDDGATVGETRPTFAWGAAPPASRYRFELATDSSFADLVVGVELRRRGYRAQGALSPGQTYFWRVAALDTVGGRFWSATRSLTIAGDPPTETPSGEPIVEAARLDGMLPPGGGYPLYASSRSGGSAAGTIVDRNLGTSWSAPANARTGAYVTVRLAATQAIGRIRWIFSDAGSAAGMSVRISANGATWTEVATGVGAVAGQWQDASVDVQATYVRFAFATPDGAAQVGGLAEVEVYPGTIAPTAAPTQTATRIAAPTRSATATRTPTKTPTPIPVKSPTPTKTPTRTPTAVPTKGPAPTRTPTAIPAKSPTPTRTSTVTTTPMPSPTGASTALPTQSPTQTATITPSPETASPTLSPTFGPSETSTSTPPATETVQVAASATDTPPPSPSQTATGTATATVTVVPTMTSTATATPTATIVPTPTTPPIDGVLLTDASFEDGDAGWYEADGAVVVSTTAHGGERSMQLQPGGSYAGQRVHLQPGVTYRFSGWGVLDRPGDVAYLGLVFRDASGVRHAELEPAMMPFPTTTWVSQKMNFTVPPGIVSIDVFAWKVSGPATFHADDLRLARIVDITRESIPPAAATCQRLTIPAYFDPETGLWGQATQAGSAVGAIVLNPNSGVGRAREPHYDAPLAQARAAGILVAGYIGTGYGTRPVAAVVADMDRYYQWYGVKSFFLDEASEAEGNLAVYQAMADHAHASGGIVILNFGWAPNERYMAFTDVAAVFEAPASLFFSPLYQPPAWFGDYPAARILVLVIDVPDALLTETIDKSRWLNAGQIWITDDSPKSGSAFNSLPSYWTALNTAARSGCGG